MEHYNKTIGVITRACSKCGGDLGDRYKKQRYCKSCHALNMRLKRPKYSELNDEVKKKVIARAYTKEYLKRGKISKEPCVKCGDVNSQIHHEDYTKPLDIVWMCRKCHLEHHASR